MNTGRSFLLVWKPHIDIDTVVDWQSPQHRDKFEEFADRAMVACLKIIISINKSPDIAKYNGKDFPIGQVLQERTKGAFYLSVAFCSAIY